MGLADGPSFVSASAASPALAFLDGNGNPFFYILLKTEKYSCNAGLSVEERRNMLMRQGRKGGREFEERSWSRGTDFGGTHLHVQIKLPHGGSNEDCQADHERVGDGAEEDVTPANLLNEEDRVGNPSPNLGTNCNRCFRRFPILS